MKANGVTFGVHTIRVTQVIGAMPRDQAILGEALVRCGFSVTIAPVIKTGETRQGYKAVDTFQHFEFVLMAGGWRRWLPIPDRQLRRILDHHCAVELWTRNLVDGVPDSTYPWIHWLFPSTSWLREGRGQWKGRSYPDGPDIRTEDYPDFGPVSDGGFWKTITPPPWAGRRVA